MALWSRSCKRVEVADIGSLVLIIPLEAEVLLIGLLIGEFDGSESILETLLKASSKGNNVQIRVLDVSFKEVEPGVWGDGACSVGDLLDRRSGAGGGDNVLNLFVDVDDMCFIVRDHKRWGGGRRGR